MKRVGPRGSGQWQRISWDEALDTIVSKLNVIRETLGPQSIALGTGTGRHLCRWVIRFASALGTPNWCEPGTAQCFVPRVKVGMVTYGQFPVGDFTGVARPKTIMYWGHNPMNSGPDGETRFAARENLENGPPTIVVDPRESLLTRTCDVWLRLRPGTDDAVALAMIHVLIEEQLYDKEFVAKWTHGFEQLTAHVKQYSPEWAEPITWVPAGKIRAAARLWAKHKPAQLEWGCALEHTPNTIQTVRAVALLPALTGNIDIPGAWVFGGDDVIRFPNLQDTMSPETKALRLGNEFKLLTGAPGSESAHIPAVWKAMREGVPYPIKAFLIFGNNALTTYANSKEVYEALMAVDFLTVTDLFMTPTAELADIVLPAAYWPEIEGTHEAPFGANYVMGPIQRAVQIGERRTDQEIIIELSKRLKLDKGTESVEEIATLMMSNGRYGTDYEGLKAKGSVVVPIEYRKHERRGFKTPTGKVELYSTILEQLGYDPLPTYQEPPESPLSQPELAKRFPLVLTTGHRSPYYFNSEGRQIKRLRKSHKDPLADIHPDTAAQHGIADGDWMWIENARGKVRQRARFSPDIDPRVIAAEHGWWFPEEAAPEFGVWKSNINTLTNDAPPYDPAMGTYQLRGLLCRVARFDSAATA
jgi:anaerobic selenocysteine-containing dehydrogenase